MESACSMWRVCWKNRFGDGFELRAERTEDGVNVVEIQIPFEAAKIGAGPDRPERGSQ